MAKLDLLLVNAPGKERVYQSLAGDLAAYEPPIWGALLASYARQRGHSVEILDAEALRYTYDETVDAIEEHAPLLVVFTIYGQQPSASTQCMPAAGDVCQRLKERCPEIMTLFLGTHPSALPGRTIEEEATDFVCQGEGPVTVVSLLQALRSGATDLGAIRGLWYREDLPGSQLALLATH
jgi:hypothetical protein